jgi:hypothetical protein
MLFELSMVTLFVVLVLLVIVFAFFAWGIKHALLLALNSVIGFFALYAVKAFVWDSLVINWISVGIVAVTGIFGFIVVLILHALGVFF